jgi:hypothetical protein
MRVKERVLTAFPRLHPPPATHRQPLSPEILGSAQTRAAFAERGSRFEKDFALKSTGAISKRGWI